jgi:hypothetical protein
MNEINQKCNHVWVDFEECTVFGNDVWVELEDCTIFGNRVRVELEDYTNFGDVPHQFCKKCDKIRHTPKNDQERL